MTIAALLLAVETAPETLPSRVIQCGIVGPRHMVTIKGKDCGRGRFVEARRFHTPWRCQSWKFEAKADAKALSEELEPAEGQSIAVVSWKRAWHEEVSDDRWSGIAKIAPSIAEGDRPLLDLVRFYAKALGDGLRPVDVMPAALPFLQPMAAAQRVPVADKRVVGADRAPQEVHAWCERLQRAGLLTTGVLIVEGAVAEQIAGASADLGFQVIAVGAQSHGLLGGWMHDEATQDLLLAAPCPVLISQIAPNSRQDRR